MNRCISGRYTDKCSGKPVTWTLTLAALAEGGNGFRGRPKLLKRILDAFEVLHRAGARSSAYRALSNIKYFWRFLDDQEVLSKALPGVEAAVIDDLTWDELESSWRLFVDWIGSKPASKFSPRTKYYINSDVHRTFVQAFEMDVRQEKTQKTHLQIYVYFQDRQSYIYGGDVLDFDEAKAAFRALARAWRNILKRIEKGRAAAATGTNPMTGSSGRNRWQGGQWSNVANRLWLVERLMPFGILCRDAAVREKARSGLQAEIRAELLLPELLQPTTGILAYAPALFLCREELAIAFAMVTMKSGLNPDSISRMTVGGWNRPDALQPDTRVTIYGPKRVGSINARASSSRVKLTDPYRIIEKVIEIQAPIRKRLAELAAETGNRQSPDRASLVWIGVGQAGAIDFLPCGSTFFEEHAFLDKFLAKAGVVRNDGSPLRYRMGQGRDVWGLFVYHRSGFNHLLTAQALGHSTLTSLLHYLEKRVLIIEDMKRQIDLQERVLVEVSEGRFAPRDYRQLERAITGLHCTDLKNPAPGADPGNGGGRSCAAQRCWTCWNWFATRESLPFLLRMIGDLEGLREELSVVLWETSDYPAMLAVYGHVVSRFHASHVEAARAPAASMAPIVRTSMFAGRGPGEAAARAAA